MTPERGLAAAIVVVLYVLLCAATLRGRSKRARASVIESATANGAPAMLVAYASQTGYAEYLARQTAHALERAGVTTRLAALSDLDARELRDTHKALFVVSTYGEGDPPDSALRFVRRTMHDAMDLAHLRYGILALGDRTYANFCGFGRALDAWLNACSAQPLFERVEVDGGDEHALNRWQALVAQTTQVADLSDWQQQPFKPWRLVARQCLNPDGAGRPCWHLELEPSPGEGLPTWQAGDLVQLIVPVDRQRPREYSISSLPADGRIHLLVRHELRADGTPGLASDWLVQGVALGDSVELRVRTNSNFHLDTNATRPLILIGNGTGLAGLRALLKARVSSGERRNWLIYGERNAAHDFYYREEIETWLAQGMLEHADLVFSRDGVQTRYVQDRLREAAAKVHEWLHAGAAVYVCGSLKGMAAGVDAALTEIVGAEMMERLRDEGRYRRDVY